MTTKGKLIAISTPYAPSGWAYETWKTHYGNDDSEDVLVWQAPSQVMNPLLDQSEIDKELAADYASARSEYFAEWREDLALFVDPDLVDQLTVKGRVQNIPEPGHKYHAYVDMSGGRNDASVLCICHKEGDKIVQDCEVAIPAPHNPFEAVGRFSTVLRKYLITKVTGDAYSANFGSEAFKTHGIQYRKVDLNKSELYLELLPLLTSERVELLDSTYLRKQLCALQRRTRSGAHDSVDHPPGQHDDQANALAGACYCANLKLFKVGSGGF